MRVLRILGKIYKDTVALLPRGKYPIDAETDFFYFVDYAAHEFKLGEVLSAAYRPDGTLLCRTSAQITYISAGWGDQQDQIYQGSHFGCGLKFSDQSFQEINSYLLISPKMGFDKNRLLYFINDQESIPEVLHLVALGYSMP